MTGHVDRLPIHHHHHGDSCRPEAAGRCQSGRDASSRRRAGQRSWDRVILDQHYFCRRIKADEGTTLEIVDATDGDSTADDPDIEELRARPTFETRQRCAIIDCGGLEYGCVMGHSQGESLGLCGSISRLHVLIDLHGSGERSDPCGGTEGF